MNTATEMDLKEISTNFVRGLRDKIVEAFQSFEPQKTFERTTWNYHNGEGGGEISLLRGDVFEKAAVNISAVHGDQFPGSDGSGPFFATGISLITHMQNPHAPTVHMNIRYIETPSAFWFGGGYDLTPMGFPYDEDTRHFHHIAQQSLDPIDPELYPQFKQQAAEYFYIPHRKHERGQGGIFFDHYNTGEIQDDLKMWKAVGNGFLESILPIYEKRIPQSYTPEEKETQLWKRGEYVEFNLIYDRGTHFGLKSGGNIDAIFCSLPPNVKW